MRVWKSALDTNKPKNHFSPSPTTTQKMKGKWRSDFYVVYTMMLSEYHERFSRIRSDMLDSACELAKKDLNLLSDELLTKLFCMEIINLMIDRINSFYWEQSLSSGYLNALK